MYRAILYPQLCPFVSNSNHSKKHLRMNKKCEYFYARFLRTRPLLEEWCPFLHFHFRFRRVVFRYGLSICRQVKFKAATPKEKKGQTTLQGKVFFFSFGQRDGVTLPTFTRMEPENKASGEKTDERSFQEIIPSLASLWLKKNKKTHVLHCVRKC